MNGAAIQALATLKMFGLLEKVEKGKIAVSKAFQSYRLAPDANVRAKQLIDFVKAPKIFEELLSAYPNGLPSDETLKHLLVVDRGFSEATASSLISDFRQSIDFSNYYSAKVQSESSSNIRDEKPTDEEADPAVAPSAPVRIDRSQEIGDRARTPTSEYDDPIPVRLQGGRKAWITLPKPFFETDKKTLAAQIDLVQADEERATKAL